MQTPSTPSIPSSGSAAQPVSAAGAAANATTSLPANSPLSALGNGSIIEGFVLNRGSDGSITLRTGQGDVTLKSDIFMKTGAQLTLRVDSAGGQNGATILTIDKRPFNLVAAEQRGNSSQTTRDGVQLSPQSQPLASSAVAASSDAAKTITLPVVQAAILDTTPEGKQQLKSFAAMLGLPDIPEDANLQLRVRLSLAGQQSQTQGQSGQQTNQTTAQNSQSQLGQAQISLPQEQAQHTLPSQTQASSANIPNQTNSPTPNNAAVPQTATPNNQDLPPQLARFSAVSTSPSTAQSSNVGPSALPLPDETSSGQHRVASGAAHHEYASLTKTESPAQLQASANRVHLQVTHKLPEGTAAPQLLGEVAGHDAKGNSIIKTPIGTLSMPVQPAPEKGAKVQLELVGVSLPTLANTSAPSAASSSSLGKTPGLDALLAHLTQASASNSTNFAAKNPLPQPGPNFTQNILGLFAAIKSGGFEQWIGRENLRSLRQAGGEELVSQVRSDFGAIRAAATMPQDESQWQSLAFPFVAEEEVQQGQLHYRKEEKETDDGLEQFTRFIVEISMSVFGLLQLDGLVVKNAVPGTPPKMDVAVRTNAPLPITMREDIMQLYSNAAEFGQFQGTVKFYAGENVFFELPRSEEPVIRSRKSQDGIVT